MMAPYQYKSNYELREDNLQLISPEKQHFYLAFYAKAAYEHVGFEDFTPENQEKFKAQIEQIYTSISSDKSQGEFLNELAEKTAKYIEDRHFEIGIGNKTFHGGEKAEPRSVGSNFFFSKSKPSGYQSLGQGWSEEGGERFPTWEIGTLKQDNEDILVVSIPNLGFKNDYESWKDFIETFDNVYLSNKEKWDRGRIVLDVRGNRGGEDKPIDHVAKRLYGNMLNTYKRCEIKDTALSNYFLHQHGAYKPQNYGRSGIKAEDLVVRNNFSGKNRTLFDETGTYYPFNEQIGYNGRIDVLIDRDVGSSAESAYTSFYHHKNVRYIGENTSGMQQYTQGTFPTPWGGVMRVAVTKLTYWDKEGENIEVKGHRPDINCSGHDAFDVTLTLGIDDGRAVGFREKNEKESENQIYAEYDPKSPTDTRKAYYAKYLDPAIAEIEKQNMSRNELRNVKQSSSDISISEPSVEHYEAFIEACKKMQAYINDDSVPNDVGKHESKGFIFARDGYVNMSKEDFEKIIVNGYKEKAQDGAEKPEYFRFIMDGDTIVGSVNVRGLPRDDFDKTNGLSTFEKWKGKRVTGAEVVLPDYRGNGIFGKAQNLLFDEMRKQGINEITFTVLSNNDGSKKAHEKMMDKYGGRMYQVYGDSDGTGIKYYNRYVISTGTSGKSKDLYKEKAFNDKNNIVINQRQNTDEFVVSFFQENFSYTPENLKSGENSVSFQHNGYRIRFPKKESSVQDYEKEAYISRYISERASDLVIPIVEVKEQDGQKFSVHQEIEGKTLIDRLPEDKDNIHFESLSNPERKKLATDIGVFLAKLHNVSLLDADSEIVKSKQMGIQAEDNPNFMEKNKTLYGDLGIEYKSVKTNQEDLVLSHNDFHGGNFILDEENNFKGAIDLGEAGINYRYKDFMSLYFSYGRGFIRDVVSSYNENSTTSISMEELDFHYLNKVADFAHYASRSEYAEKSPQLQKMFDKCISDYQSDKSQENIEKELAKARQKISENKSPSKTIAELRGISSTSKGPSTTTNPKTSDLLPKYILTQKTK